MDERPEKLIKLVYKKWKSHHDRGQGPHPDEESWACFTEGKLSKEEGERIKKHAIGCDSCCGILSALIESGTVSPESVPRELIDFARGLSSKGNEFSVAEIVLKLTDKALEIVSTTGDVLVGNEVVPALVLRSRKIKEFKDEVTILKDFKDIRVEVKVENKEAQAFDLIIFVKDKQTHRMIKDLRVTLLKDDLELESYVAVYDKVIFEHVLAGKYTVEISNIESKMASILLDIRR